MIFLGGWGTEVQAAQAYDQAAIAYGVRNQARVQLSPSAETEFQFNKAARQRPCIYKAFWCIKQKLPTSLI